MTQKVEIMIQNEEEKIDGLVNLSKKFHGHAANQNAADPSMMMKLSALYMEEAALRMRRLAERQKPT